MTIRDEPIIVKSYGRILTGIEGAAQPPGAAVTGFHGNVPRKNAPHASNVPLKNTDKAPGTHPQ